MPQLNGTGPEGQGTRTGRKLGQCHSKGLQDDQNAGTGFAIGKRMGRMHGKPSADKSGNRHGFNKNSCKTNI